MGEFVEGGATGTHDKRPVFQQMIERACDGDNAFDVITVHSYSRFFRKAFGQEFYLRKSAKQGVKLVSITQPLGDDDRLIEDSTTEVDDVLKDRLNSLKADRGRAKTALERAKSHSSRAIRIDPAPLEQFGRSMRENFTSGSIPFRKANLQSLIDVIEVDAG